MKIKIFSTKLQINSDKFKRDAIMYLEQLPQSLRRKEGKDSIMGIKIGINGFGRIGRVVMRILAEDPEKFEVCGINLRKADIDYMVYLLKYDSVFRNFPGMIEHAGGDLVVNGRKIKVYSESDAAMINWADCGAEYIIESTGANNTTEKASRHFKGGAKKVLLTAPAKDEVIVKSARNIPGVVTSMANLINVYDILNAKYLVLDKEALAVIEEVFA